MLSFISNHFSTFYFSPQWLYSLVNIRTRWLSLAETLVVFARHSCRVLFNDENFLYADYASVPFLGRAPLLVKSPCLGESFR